MSSPFDAPGLGGIFEGMQRFQSELAAAEAAAGATEVEGSSGGGAVRIRAAGEFSFTSVSIDASVIAGGDAELVEDLVLAALRDTAAQLIEVRRSAMGQVVGGALSAMFGSDDAAPENTSDDETPPGALGS